MGMFILDNRVIVYLESTVASANSEHMLINSRSSVHYPTLSNFYNSWVHEITAPEPYDGYRIITHSI